MTSGPPRFLLCVLFATAAIARAGEVDRVAAFLATLASPPTGFVPFVERRMSVLLVTPIEVRGEILLGSDGSIDKRVTAPVVERMQIGAGTLTLERAGQQRTLNLAGDPRWRMFHAGLTGLFRRDATALTRVFAVSLGETSAGWTLTLRPRRAGGVHAVTLIRAAGVGPNLVTLRLEQGEGEWQELTFSGGS